MREVDIADKVKVNWLNNFNNILIDGTGGRLPAVLYFVNLNVRQEKVENRFR